MAQYRNELIAIGTSSLVVGANFESLNLKRKNIIITNTSTGGEVITISVGQEAVANQGIVLYAGGSWDANVQGVFLPPQVRISAISSAIGGQLSVYEEAF